MLPQLIRTLLVELIREKTTARYTGHEVIITYLLKVLLIEALRTNSDTHFTSLIRSLADEQLNVALRLRHDLCAGVEGRASAREAGLSRTVFLGRFRSEVGAAPMDRLMTWQSFSSKTF